jgi:8-oxo-dGTP diphosphatase
MIMIAGKDFTGISIVFFCHDGNGSFVMAQRSQNARDEHGRWDIGGGRLSTHDSVEETLKREIMEEYASPVLDYSYLGYRDVHRGEGQEKTHWIALDFKVHVERSSVHNGEPHKFDQIGWFTVDALPASDALHSQLPSFFSQYSDQLR